MSVTIERTTIPNVTLTLPNPTFGNSQNNRHTLTVRHDINGGTKTYIQRSKNVQLDMTFDNINATEFANIKSYIASYLQEELQLTDQYSRVYIGHIVTEPIDYVENRPSCSYTVTLNFVGELQ